MASCTASTSAKAVQGLPVLRGQVGLRAAGKVDSVCMVRRGGASWQSSTLSARSVARTRCEVLSAPIIISASTASLLFLGRFVFLPFQRKQVANQGLPVQNGVTHFEAGDTRAAEVSSLLQTKDPAGFTLIDVLAWGALGHALGFFILATASNGYEPQF